MDSFAMSVKDKNPFMAFFINFYIACLLKSFFKGHILY
jgi:hypothetical protein